MVDVGEGERTKIRARQMGFVFQDFNLVPTLTAIENVMLACDYAGIPGSQAKTMAIEALALVGLADRADHRPAELSGGEQQRVAIARALVNKPSLILADEPTGNLDSERTDEVLALLRSFNREHGQTFILVTHDPDVAGACDRVVRMRDGKIRQEIRNPVEPIAGVASGRDAGARTGCSSASPGQRNGRSGGLAGRQVAVPVLGHPAVPGVDAGGPELADARVMDGDRVLRSDGPDEIDRLGQLQPRRLGGHEQRVDRLLGDEQRVPGMVDPPVHDVAEVGAVRQSAVDEGVTVADRRDREPRGFERLARRHPRDVDAFDVGTGRREDGKPGGREAGRRRYGRRARASRARRRRPRGPPARSTRPGR